MFIRAAMFTHPLLYIAKLYLYFQDSTSTFGTDMCMIVFHICVAIYISDVAIKNFSWSSISYNCTMNLST